MTGRFLALMLCAAGAIATAGTEAHATHTTQKGTEMKEQARGTFEVKVTSLAADEKVEGLVVGRNGIAKQFTGDFEGTSKGEMMSTGTAVEGSAGYVAIERVEGALKGRTGSFLLLHQGTMKRGGDFKLAVVVVPDSGTGQLIDLAGTMTIIIEGGKHRYEFDYTLPPLQ